ncbi:MAG: diadenylate cyclase CdaA [Zetaproteobacteria bacterium]|nr:diadenylate cyclase CdaA [Zetaproteobacteria bacterium]
MFQILDQFGWWAVLDIALVAVVIYYVLLLVRGTRTAQVLAGVLILVGAFLLSSAAPLTVVNWVMNKFYSSIILILVILFQDDVRHGLGKIGKQSLIKGTDQNYSRVMLEEVSKAAFSLASRRVGALIVFERNIILSRYVDIGIPLDAKVSKELLMTIFVPQTPLHDGAVILQQGKLAAAGCFLPLTRMEDLSKDLGTRHRAAIGISQETDALVVLISEERGDVCWVVDGEIKSVQKKDQLTALLNKKLDESSQFFLRGRLRKV